MEIDFSDTTTSEMIDRPIILSRVSAEAEQAGDNKTAPRLNLALDLALARPVCSCINVACRLVDIRIRIHTDAKKQEARSSDSRLLNASWWRRFASRSRFAHPTALGPTLLRHIPPPPLSRRLRTDGRANPTRPVRGQSFISFSLRREWLACSITIDPRPFSVSWILSIYSSSTAGRIALAVRINELS